MSVKVDAANETALDIEGAVCVTFRLGILTYEHWFLVAPRLPVDVLLGNDWLMEQDAFVGVGRKLLLLKGQPAVRGTIAKEDRVLLKSKITCCVPARSRSFIAVTTGPIIWEEGGREVLVEPFVQKHNTGYSIAPAVHTINKNRMLYVEVLNSEETEVCIEEGEVVGRMTPLKDTAKCMLLLFGGEGRQQQT